MPFNNLATASRILYIEKPLRQPKRRRQAVKKILDGVIHNDANAIPQNRGESLFLFFLGKGYTGVLEICSTGLEKAVAVTIFVLESRGQGWVIRQPPSVQLTTRGNGSCGLAGSRVYDRGQGWLLCDHWGLFAFTRPTAKRARRKI